jgi:hypothetical protein
MLRLVCLLAFILGVSGCGQSEGVDCEARMVWDGFVYAGVGTDASDPPESGPALGTGYTLACDNGGREREVQVFAVRGVDPADAILTESGSVDGPTIWQGPGRAHVEASRTKQHPFAQDRS